MFGRRGLELKTPEQQRAMRRAGLVVSRALDAACAAAVPGATTAEVDAAAAEVILGAGAVPSFLDYGADAAGRGGFPGVVCVSVNEEIVHGIPGERVLADGDVVSIDCGAVVDGWHGDSARTVLVGAVSEAARGLSDVTRAALAAGIGAMRAGGRVGDISAAIETAVRGANPDLGIVEEYVGHGIGSEMHMEPDVPNWGRAGRGPRLAEGVALAIEPMVTLGQPDNVTLDDEWTVVTRDASLAVHWEHTVTITPGGLWVTTAEDGGEALLAGVGAPFGPLAD